MCPKVSILGSEKLWSTLILQYVSVLYTQAQCFHLCHTLYQLHFQWGWIMWWSLFTTTTSRWIAMKFDTDVQDVKRMDNPTDTWCQQKLRLILWNITPKQLVDFFFLQTHRCCVHMILVTVSLICYVVITARFGITQTAFCQSLSTKVHLHSSQSHLYTKPELQQQIAGKHNHNHSAIHCVVQIEVTI